MHGKSAKWRKELKRLHGEREKCVMQGNDDKIDFYNSQLALHHRKESTRWPKLIS